MIGVQEHAAVIIQKHARSFLARKMVAKIIAMRANGAKAGDGGEVTKRGKKGGILPRV